MPWFRVDDNLAFHHKVVAAGNSAMGLWVRAGSWCALQLTDGLVPEQMLAALGTKQQAERLVAAGLWVREEKGYRFHEWTVRQPDKATIEAERAQSRARMQKVRAAKKGTASDGSSAAPQVSEPGAPEVQPNNGRTSPEVRSAPTQPSPAQPVVPNGTTETAPRKRGTRIADDFVVTDGMREWAATNVPSIYDDLAAATAEFVDYWRAIPGSRGTKLDWVATWRNRMRDVSERRERVRPIRPAEGWWNTR